MANIIKEYNSIKYSNLKEGDIVIPIKFLRSRKIPFGEKHKVSHTAKCECKGLCPHYGISIHIINLRTGMHYSTCKIALQNKEGNNLIL